MDFKGQKCKFHTEERTEKYSLGPHTYQRQHCCKKNINLYEMIQHRHMHICRSQKTHLGNFKIKSSLT